MDGTIKLTSARIAHLIYPERFVSIITFVTIDKLTKMASLVVLERPK